MTHASDPAVIERVAEAVWTLDHLVEWKFASPTEREGCANVARAALASIPEVGEEAVRADEREACAKIADAAELEAARAENAWRPIESAPTDQKQILVGFMGQASWYSFVAYALGAETASTGRAPPTHWCPIPPPPQEPTK